MTKPELVDSIIAGSDVELTKAQVEAVLSGFTDAIVKNVLKKGDSIGLPGLGTFKQKKTKARVGRNPQTGATLKISAKTKIGFSMSSTLKN